MLYNICTDKWDGGIAAALSLDLRKLPAILGSSDQNEVRTYTPHPQAA